MATPSFFLNMLKFFIIMPIKKTDGEMYDYQGKKKGGKSAIYRDSN